MLHALALDGRDSLVRAVYLILDMGFGAACAVLVMRLRGWRK